MKHVKIWGGLGNQLFQYAYALYLSQRFSNVTLYTVPTGSKCELDKIILGQNRLQVCDIPAIPFRSGLVYRLYRKCSLLLRSPFKLYVEPDLFYHSELPEKVYFDGYWQSFLYVDSVSAKLRDAISFDHIALNDQESAIASEIENAKSVSLHIRRGDYLSGANLDIYESCDLNYYQAAIDHIKHIDSDSQFFVFSNDINWAKEFLTPISANLRFVDIENGNYLNELRMMSMCKHNIIANSTFSWWGAWLNNHPNKIVIAPKKWYKGDLNLVTRDLISKEWTRI